MAFVNLPANLQDIFNSITDRIAKLETGPSEAMYTAEAAQGSSSQAIAQAQAANALGVQALAEADIAIAQGTQAIQTANAALVSAGVAYSAAIGSLQPSASTIVNASNQMTAIASNGITVYSGSSATSGARVVMNSTGLAGYNASNVATFSVTASTGAAVFSGSVTGATITGGTLNIGGNAIINSSGYLTATGATITGAITATSGTFTGTVYASAGTFTGTITSSNATITGGTLTVGANFSVGSTGVLTATGANITGQITATSGSFTGAVTATSGSFTGAIYASSGYIGAAATGWNFSSSGYIQNNDFSTILYPTAAASVYALITNRSVSANKLQATSTASDSIAIGGGGNVAGTLIINKEEIALTTQIYGGYGVISDWAPNVDNTYNIGQTGTRRWSHIYANNTTVTTSDARVKTDVINSPLGLDFIESLRPVSYRWIVGRQEVVKDAESNPIIIGEDAEGKPIFETTAVPGVRLHYGFIAQEVKQAVNASGVQDFAGWVQDDMTNPDSMQSLSYEQFIAPMAKAIQELSARIQQLEGA